MTACGQNKNDSSKGSETKKYEENTENKETESKGTESKETESKETESKETENKETENKETESKETESKETENKEPENKEPENKETEGSGENNENNAPPVVNKVIVEIKSDKSEINVGEELTFSIDLNSTEKIASCALKLSYDTDCFEIVNGEMFKDAFISDFSNAIGVFAFSKPMSINGEVMTFTLKAKKAVEKSKVSCEVSLKGEADKAIENIEFKSVDITVK